MYIARGWFRIIQKQSLSIILYQSLANMLEYMSQVFEVLFLFCIKIVIEKTYSFKFIQNFVSEKV